MEESISARPLATINPLRAVLQVTVGWFFTFLFTVTVTVLSLITLGRVSYWLTPIVLRFWGRTMLWIQGVKLDVEGAEHFSYTKARVATFNHTSSLDAMIIPAIIPPGSTVAIKREVIYVPFVGLAAWAIGFLLVNRGKSERAKKVLAKAADRMRRQKLTVFIAPEGTRSRDGKLQPFKRGAFHLAQASGAAVAPVVICDACALHPRDRLVSRQGTIKIRILEAIETTDLTVEGIPAFAEALHDIYVRELEDMRAG